MKLRRWRALDDARPLVTMAGEDAARIPAAPRIPIRFFCKESM